MKAEVLKIAKAVESLGMEAADAREEAKKARDDAEARVLGPGRCLTATAFGELGLEFGILISGFGSKCRSTMFFPIHNVFLLE